jgi:hypothetical protein
MGSNRQTYVADLVDTKSTASRGKLIIRLDNVAMSNDEVRFKASATLTPMGNFCCAGVNNPYFVFLRTRDPMSQDDFVRVY